MKTTIFAMSFFSIILLAAQPSNCFDPYHDLEEAYDIYHDILGLNPDAVPTDPFDQPTFFSEDDYETQYDFGESYDAFPDDALPPLPFESIQAAPGAPEYLFDRNTFRLADSAPFPLQKLPYMLPYFDFVTQQPSTAIAATRSSLMISTSRKQSRAEATYQCGHPGCTNSYVTKCGLNKHDITAHRKKTPHKCPSCTNTYAYKCELERHISGIHRKEKLHECPLCPSAYAYRGGLNKHVISAHRKEKPHKCPNCTNAYALRRDLILHINTAHGKEKTDECQPLIPYASEQAPTTGTDLTVDSDNYTDESNLCKS